MTKKILTRHKLKEIILANSQLKTSELLELLHKDYLIRDELLGCFIDHILTELDKEHEV